MTVRFLRAKENPGTTANHRSINLYDSHVGAWMESPPHPSGDTLGVSDAQWSVFRGLLDVLSGMGFAVTKDPRIEANHKTLSEAHRYGRRGDLEFVAEACPRYVKFEFFQNVVFENRNGGRYDFDKLQKMPYLVRKLFELARQKMVAWLVDHGYTHRPKAEFPNPDPLAWFNDKWDGAFEISRGVHRFARDESGWPSRAEIGHWGTKDHDGVELYHGEVRYFRNRRGRLMRGRVYGGINGMWTVVYGPGLRDCEQLVASALFMCHPAHEPARWFPAAVRRQRLEAAMASAIKRLDFERAAKIRDVLGLPLGAEA